MVIKTSICVALACAGLSPVAAGLVFHVRHAAPAAVVPAKQVSPWGTLPGVAGAVDDASQAVAPTVLPAHLGLAPQTEGVAQATTETAVSETTQTRVVEQNSVSPDLIKAADVASSPAETPAVQSAAPPETGPAPARREAALAPATEPSPGATPDDDGASPHVRPGMVFNINTASITELNHIPGMSNIGRAIVAHRPYRTIGDLVSHRVLKTGDFQRVKDKVKV